MESKKPIDLIKKADDKQKSKMLQLAAAKMKDWENQIKFRQLVIKNLLDELGVSEEEALEVVAYVDENSALTNADKRHAENKAQALAEEFHEEADPLT